MPTPTTEGGPAGATDMAASAARAEVFETLDKEMELYDYATAESGHKVRSVPRSQRAQRQAKRMALQKEDMMEMAVEATEDFCEDDDGGEATRGRKRLRGPLAAFDDAVLKGMPLSDSITRKQSADENDNREFEDPGFDQSVRDNMLEQVAALGIIDLDHDEGEKIDDAEDGDGVDYINDDEDKECDEATNSRSKGVESEGKRNEEGLNLSKAKFLATEENGNVRIKVCKTGLVKPTKRIMHRLRDFTSQKLAEKHGEAIGAYVRGMSETAVQKLRGVAKSAPGAPQVYSSLGMVFDSMRREVDGGDPGDPLDGKLVDYVKRLQHRSEIAQKAYAAYHVSAVLCRRDYILWARSGDAASEVAQIYSELIDHMANHPEISSSDREEAETSCKGFDLRAGAEKWRSQRKTWLEHALAAYQSSDGLRPPDVGIPCKLALVHISVGNYIDALSILTDLRLTVHGKSSDSKNGPARQLERSEVAGSYSFWLLYADLMMKIGYECKLWNDGTYTNDDFMAKRWLRKNSVSFDWKERRLQALCLALEAAAGSSSCTELVKWMRGRATNEKSSSDGNPTNTDAEDVNGNTERAGCVDKVKSLSYDEERAKIVHVNKVELEKFDRTTKEMNLVPGTCVFKNRITARAVLVEKHRTAIKRMAAEKYRAKDKQDDSESLVGEKACSPKDELCPKPLPLRGSFATIYHVVSLLLRQCIQLKLFKGGVLAVQSVLNYYKERMILREKKEEMLRGSANLPCTDMGLDIKATDIGLDIKSGFKYDKINLDSDGSDEESVDISDEEDIAESTVLHSLKSENLPLDIRSMHAICLLGAGGKDFLALSYLEQVIQSNEIDLFETDVDQDAGIVGDQDAGVGDPKWISFTKYVDAPITRSFVLASVADLVTENSKGHRQAYRVVEIFRKYFFRLADINHGLDLDQALSSSNELERVQSMKILIAALKLLVYCQRVDLAMLDHLGKEKSMAIRRVTADSTYTLKTMTRFQYILWNPSFVDWSLPQPSIDSIKILSGTLDILVEATTLLPNKYMIGRVIKKLKSRYLLSILSKICQADNAPLPVPSTTMEIGTWRSFPLPCSWQTSFHEKISLKAYNLCVACCVSSFSGWEPTEFNLDRLHNSDINFFGVVLDSRVAAGFLPREIASVIAEQWHYVRTAILPDLERLPFETHLDQRRGTPWYQKVMRNMDRQKIDPTKIALYGEEDGIKALLSFSMLCLVAAEESEGIEKDECVKMSMSILLPMTQFCIDREVWQSNIGTAVITGRNESSFYLDDESQWLGPRKSKQGKIQFASNTKSQRTQIPFKPIKTRKRPQHANIVNVPASSLLKEWKKDDDLSKPDQDMEHAQKSMKEVDDAMKNLRKSRTLSSLERACIDVSVALLSLVDYDECNNPFLCLQQAVMFAGMGSKKGNNDEPFKRFLPLKNLCTPTDALNILGRADCLRAIHFLHEAQYLCGWVASVCSSHRLNKPGIPWNSRWRAVSIVTYVVSATIDETCEILFQDDPDVALKKWEEVAKEEFNRGKSEALVLLTIKSGPTSYSDGPFNDENLLVGTNVTNSNLPSDQSQASSKSAEMSLDEVGEPDHGSEFDHCIDRSDPNAQTSLAKGVKVPAVGDSQVGDRHDNDIFANVEVVGI